MVVPSASPLSDPAATSTLGAAISWVEVVLLGPIAVAIATIAVASIGYLMLVGRIEVRRGATIVLGCFLVFGAKSLSGALLALSGGGTSLSPAAQVVAPTATPSFQAPAPAQYDPYAGASVPQVR